VDNGRDGYWPNQAMQPTRISAGGIAPEVRASSPADMPAADRQRSQVSKQRTTAMWSAGRVALEAHEAAWAAELLPGQGLR